MLREMTEEQDRLMQQPPIMPWVTEENWPRLLELAKDSDELPQIFREYADKFEQVRQTFTGAGYARFVPELVVIDPDECASWCRQNGRHMDKLGRASFASTPSRSYCGVEPVQLNAGLFGSELPIRFNVSFVAARPPSGDFVGQSLLVGDALCSVLLEKRSAMIGCSRPTPPNAVSTRCSARAACSNLIPTMRD
jgi:hypothetical protein